VILPPVACRYVGEDQLGLTDQEFAAPAPAGEPLMMEGHPGGFHVRAVAIDQRFDLQ